MKAWTDYPFCRLGDVLGMAAPIRQVEVLSYDGDKYCRILVEGLEQEIKAGYLYSTSGRFGDVPVVDINELTAKW